MFFLRAGDKYPAQHLKAASEVCSKSCWVEVEALEAFGIHTIGIETQYGDTEVKLNGGANGMLW